MTWIQRYKLRNYVRNSIWILPVFGMVAALVTVTLTRRNAGLGQPGIPSHLILPAQSKMKGMSWRSLLRGLDGLEAYRGVSMGTGWSSTRTVLCPILRTEFRR